MGREWTNEKQKALDKALNIERESESQTVKIVGSTIKKEGVEQAKQYKVTIPMKFARAINLDPKKHVVEFTLDKQDKEGSPTIKIRAEIVQVD
jgi:hypothetical protein